MPSTPRFFARFPAPAAEAVFFDTLGPVGSGHVFASGNSPIAKLEFRSEVRADEIKIDPRHLGELNERHVLTGQRWD